MCVQLTAVILMSLTGMHMNFPLGTTKHCSLLKHDETHW
jgi:hypothetical protein